MLTRSLILLALFAYPAVLPAADPVPVADPIQFPPSPAPPVPAPPAPGAAVKLAGKQVYPVTRVAPFVLRAYPAGVVSIRKVEIAAGETHHFEKEFSDGTTEKSFKGPLLVYFVSPAGKGNIDLVATPIGLKAEAEIVTKTLDVDAGKGPQPPPGPTPPVPPVPPGPAPDAALVAALKAALAKDILAGVGSKETAANLAIVYDSGAQLLDLADPAIAPRTVGDLYTKMVGASIAKGVPRPPYFKEVRAVVDVNLPLLNGESAMTDEVKKQFQTKYRALAAALAEAAK